MLLPRGFWHTTFWIDNFWHEDFWLSGAPSTINESFTEGLLKSDTSLHQMIYSSTLFESVDQTDSQVNIGDFSNILSEISDISDLLTSMSNILNLLNEDLIKSELLTARQVGNSLVEDNLSLSDILLNYQSLAISISEVIESFDTLIGSQILEGVLLDGISNLDTILNNLSGVANISEIAECNDLSQANILGNSIVSENSLLSDANILFSHYVNVILDILIKNDTISKDFFLNPSSIDSLQIDDNLLTTTEKFEHLLSSLIGSDQASIQTSNLTTLCSEILKFSEILNNVNYNYPILQELSTLGDTLGHRTNFNTVTTESITMNEVLLNIGILFSLANEEGIFTESLDRFGTFYSLLSSNTRFSSSINNLITWMCVSQDDISLMDIKAGSLLLGKVLLESCGLSETIISKGDLVDIVADAIRKTESIRGFFNFDASAAETLVSLDSISSIENSQTYNIDTISTSESLDNTSLEIPITVNENTTLSTVIIKVLKIYKLIVDNGKLSDVNITFHEGGARLSFLVKNRTLSFLIKSNL